MLSYIISIIFTLHLNNIYTHKKIILLKMSKLSKPTHYMQTGVAASKADAIFLAIIHTDK